MSLRPRNTRLVQGVSPFVVATPETQAALDLAPFGLAIPESHRFDPLRTGTAPFLDRLSRLDAATFGPEGMPMPRWIFYDGAELTGMVFGLARDAAELTPREREVLAVDEAETGPMPLAMYIAIPTWEEGIWVGHNLASLAGRLGDEMSGLGGVVKALGLRVTRARRQLGATQWDSVALFVHTRMGPLDLLTAWTPAHSRPDTLTYGVDVSEAGLRSLARDPDGRIEQPDPTEHVRSDDHGAMQRLQERIEAGERLVITGRPLPSDDGGWRVPIATKPGNERARQGTQAS